MEKAKLLLFIQNELVKKIVVPEEKLQKKINRMFGYFALSLNWGVSEMFLMYGSIIFFIACVDCTVLD